MKLPVEFVLPETGAEPVPVHPVHAYRVPPDSSAGVVTEELTVAPESYQPAPVGVSCAELTANWYCVFQFHVTLEAAVILKLPVEFVLPDGGAEPVPVHPVHAYRVPPDSSAGVVTEELTVVPLSYQPAPVGVSCAELTAN